MEHQTCQLPFLHRLLTSKRPLGTSQPHHYHRQPFQTSLVWLHPQGNQNIDAICACGKRAQRQLHHDWWFWRGYWRFAGRNATDDSVCSLNDHCIWWYSKYNNQGEAEVEQEQWVHQQNSPLLPVQHQTYHASRSIWTPHCKYETGNDSKGAF